MTRLAILQTGAGAACVLSARLSRIVAELPIAAPRTRALDDHALLDLEREVLRALGVA